MINFVSDIEITKIMKKPHITLRKQYQQFILFPEGDKMYALYRDYVTGKNMINDDMDEIQKYINFMMTGEVSTHAQS